MESTKTHMGKTYAFDATAQGMGLWKQVTKAGKLGKIAPGDLQKRWGNPNEEGPLFTPPPAPMTNVEKLGEKIESETPKPQRLKTFSKLLRDPNETIKSAATKSIRQNLRPEMMMKTLFGPMAGKLTAKALEVSPERMDAVERGFEGERSPSYNSEDSRGKKTQKEELKTIDERLKESNSYLKKISDYFEQKRKEEDIANNFKGQKPKAIDPIKKTSDTTATSTAEGESGGGGIMDLIGSLMGSLGGLVGGVGLGGLGKTILKVMGKAFLGLAKKLPIIGPVILGLMGLKDAYDEYMSGGDFSDAVGAFFESVADGLTFGLSTKLTGEGGIKKFISGIVDSGLDFFEDMMDTIGDFIKDNLIDPIVNIPQTLLNGIKGVVGNILESIGNLSFEIPEFTLIPKTPFTDAVKIGPYKISPFSGLAETGKSLKEAAEKGKADLAAEAAQKQEERAKRDTEKQERRAERDERKAERAAGAKEEKTSEIPEDATPIRHNGEVVGYMPKEGGIVPLPGMEERLKAVQSATRNTINANKPESTGATPQLSNNITFSEKDLSEKDPELYKQFVERKEQLKQELAKNPRYQSRIGARQLEDAANVQAQQEFAERAQKVGAAQITPTATTGASTPTATPTATTEAPTPTATPTTSAPPSGPAPSAIPARQQNTQENLGRMRQALAEQGITDPNLQQATLANVMKETGGTNVSENLNYRNTSNERIRKIFGSRASQYSDEQLNEIKKDPEKMGELMYGSGTEMGRRMGNTEAGEGYKFRGRGFVQLTGKTNYAKASQALFGDDRLVKDPDLLNDPDIAAKASAWYMKDTQAGMAKQLGIDPKNMTPEQAQLLATSQIAGRDVSKMGDYGKELQSKVAAAASGNQVQTAMATTPQTQSNVQVAEAKPELAQQVALAAPAIPQSRTGEIIDQSASQLASTQGEAAIPPPAPAPVVNNITNNSGGTSPRPQGPVAQVRNEDNTFMQLLNMYNSVALA